MERPGKINELRLLPGIAALAMLTGCVQFSKPELTELPTVEKKGARPGSASSSPSPAASPSPVVSPTPIPTARYYVAPYGNDSNPGTKELPFRSLSRLENTLVAGDLVYVRGGTYAISRPTVWGELEHLNYLSGTASAPIRIENYPGEKPVFDFAGSTHNGGSLLHVVGSHHLRIKGLRLTNLPQVPGGSLINGVLLEGSTNVVIENVEVDHIGGYGFTLGGGAHNNLFLNCDAHHMGDPYSSYAWNGSNGFNQTGGVDATGNVIDGCRAWCMSDDGYDLFGTDGHITIKNSWSFWNGYDCRADGTRVAVGDGMGFKLGPIYGQYPTTVKRVITGNLAFENKTAGFDQNGNGQGQGIYQLHNNTAFRNGYAGFTSGNMSGVTHSIHNNVSYGDPVANQDADWNGSQNSWNLNLGLTDADFQSVSPAGVDGPRQADGSLPNLPFLKPSAGSKLLNQGTSVGLPYQGSAPDLGAYEY